MGGKNIIREYINSEIYTPEKVISRFTLALLEDNRWYKIDNHYISGSMRFGKNQGCNFLTTDCEAKVISNLTTKKDGYTAMNYAEISGNYK